MPKYLHYDNSPYRRNNMNAEELDAIAQEYGLNNQTSALRLLLDFYNLKRIDVFINRLKDRYEQGLTLMELAQLSVLESYLNKILH